MIKKFVKYDKLYFAYLDENEGTVENVGVWKTTENWHFSAGIGGTFTPEYALSID